MTYKSSRVNCIDTRTRPMVVHLCDYIFRVNSTTEIILDFIAFAVAANEYTLVDVISICCSVHYHRIIKFYFSIHSVT